MVQKANYGEFYGWKMLAALWVIYGLMQGFVIYGGPVLNTYMVLDMHFSRSVLGIGSSVFLVFQALAGPFAARAVNKRGIRFTIVLGAIVTAVSALLMGFKVSSPLGYLICFGAISGLGLGFSGMFSVQSGINYWFTEKRALAQAIALTGSGVGGFLAGHVFNWIISSVGGGWHMGWAAIGGSCILTIIVTLLYVVNRPEDIGQIPDGRSFDNVINEKRYSRVYKAAKNVPVHEVVRDYRIWGIILGLVAIRFSYNICLSQGIIHLLDQHISETIAVTSIGSMTLLGIIGRLGSGLIADKVEPRYVWGLGMIIYFMGFLALWTASSTTYVFIYSACVGIGFGIAYVSSTTMIANYYGADTFTSIMGFAFPIQHVAGALGPLVAGGLYDFTGSYNGAFTIASGLLVLGIAGVYAAVLPKNKKEALKSVEKLATAEM